MKKVKIVVVVFLIVALIGGVIGYRMWNKAPVKVESVEGVRVTVAQLSDEYTADEAKANEKYLNKALVVTGAVTEVQDNQDGKKLVIMEGQVQCTMRDMDTTPVVGQTITVKGFCTGSSLFGVMLSDCVVQ